jgi:hypothetical protein
MENLFREILAPSPLLSAAPLPIGVPSSEAVVPSRPTPASSGTLGATMTTPAEPMIDWEGEAEMQRLLDMLPDVVAQDTTDENTLDAADEFPAVLELGLAGWDLTSPSAVPAF